MAMYLLHGTLMRSILAYLVWGPKLLFDWRERHKFSSVSTKQAADTTWKKVGTSSELGSSDNKQGPAGAPPTPPPPAKSTPELLQLPSGVWIAFCILIFFVVLLVAVAAWNKKVEPVFARATAAMERVCLPKENQQIKALKPTVGEEERSWLEKKREDDEGFSPSENSSDEWKNNPSRDSGDRKGGKGSILPPPVTFK